MTGNADQVPVTLVNTPRFRMMIIDLMVKVI